MFLYLRILFYYALSFLVRMVVIVALLRLIVYSTLEVIGCTLHLH